MIIKRALFGSLASVVLVNQIPMQYIYQEVFAVDESMTGEFKEISPEIIDYLNYGRGDQSDRWYKGTVEIKVSFKLKDPSNPKGDLIAKVKYMGNEAGESWTGKTRWSLSKPTAFNYNVDSLKSIIGDEETAETLSEWYNNYYRDYGAGISAKKKYNDYVIPYEEDEDFLRYKEEVDNLFTIKKTGGISNNSKFGIEYEATVPAKYRGTKATIIGAFTKINLGKWQKDVAYIYDIPPIPEENGTKFSEKGYVGIEPYQLPRGEDVNTPSSISEESKRVIKQKLIEVNTGMGNGITQNVNLDYSEAGYVKIIFSDQSEIKSPIGNFAKNFVEIQQPVYGPTKDYIGNDGNTYRVTLPQRYDNVEIDKVKGAVVNSTSETYEVLKRLSNSNGNKGDEAQGTKSVSIAVNRVVNAGGVEILKSVRVSTRDGELISQVYKDEYGYYLDTANGAHGKEYKDLDATKSIRFYYVKEEDDYSNVITYDDQGNYRYNINENIHIDVPVRDLISNVTPDTGAADNATGDYKDKAKDTIDQFSNLTSQRRNEIKQNIENQDKISEIEKIVQKASRENAQETLKKAELDAYKTKAKNKIAGLDEATKKEFSGLTKEDIDDLKTKIDAKTDKAGVDEIVEEAKRLSFQRKQERAKAELNTYPDDIKEKYIGTIDGVTNEEELKVIMDNARLEKEKVDAIARIKEAERHNPQYDKDEIRAAIDQINASQTIGKPSEIASTLIKKMMDAKKEEVKDQINDILGDSVSEEDKQLFEEALGNAENDSDIEDVIKAAKAASKIAEAKSFIDGLTHLNNAQKQNFKDSLEIGIDKDEINNIKQQAMILDNKMEILSDFTNTIEGKTQEQGYIDITGKDNEKNLVTEVLQKAKAVTAPTGKGYTQNGVENLIAEIKEKYNAVTGTSVEPNHDKLIYVELEELINESDDLKESAKYKYSTQDEKTAYDQKLEAAKELLAEVKGNSPTSTQTTINEMVDALKDVREELNGVAPSNTTLGIDSAVQSYDKDSGKQKITVTLQESGNGTVDIYKGDDKVGTANINGNVAEFDMADLAGVQDGDNLQFIITETGKTPTNKIGSVNIDKKAPALPSDIKANIVQNIVEMRLTSEDDNPYKPGDVITVLQGDEVIGEKTLAEEDIQAGTVIVNLNSGKNLTKENNIKVKVTDNLGNASDESDEVTPADKFEGLSVSKEEAKTEKEKAKVDYHLSDSVKQDIAEKEAAVDAAITAAETVLANNAASDQEIATAKENLDRAKNQLKAAKDAAITEAKAGLNSFIDALGLEDAKKEELKGKVNELTGENVTKEKLDAIQNEAVEEFKIKNPNLGDVVNRLKADQTASKNFDGNDGINADVEWLKSLSGKITELKTELGKKVKNRIKYLNEETESEKTAYDTAYNNAKDGIAYNEDTGEIALTNDLEAQLKADGKIDKLLENIRNAEQALNGTFKMDIAKTPVVNAGSFSEDEKTAIKAAIKAANPALADNKINDITFNDTELKVTVTFNNDGTAEADENVEISYPLVAKLHDTTATISKVEQTVDNNTQKIAITVGDDHTFNGEAYLYENGTDKVMGADGQPIVITIANGVGSINLSEINADVKALNGKKYKFSLKEAGKLEGEVDNSDDNTVTIDTKAPVAAVIRGAIIGGNNVLVEITKSDDNPLVEGDKIQVKDTEGNVIAEKDITAEDIGTENVISIKVPLAQDKSITEGKDLIVNIIDGKGNISENSDNFTPSNGFKELKDAIDLAKAEKDKTPVDYHVSEEDKAGLADKLGKLKEAISAAENVFNEKGSTQEQIATAKKNVDDARTEMAKVREKATDNAKNYVNEFIDALELDEDKKNELKAEVNELTKDTEDLTAKLKAIQDKAVDEFKSKYPNISNVADSLKSENTADKNLENVDDVKGLLEDINKMKELSAELDKLKAKLKANVQNQVKYLNETTEAEKETYKTAYDKAVADTGYVEADKNFTGLEADATKEQVTELINKLTETEANLNGTFIKDTENKVLIADMDNLTGEDKGEIEAKIRKENPNLEAAGKIKTITFDDTNKQVVIKYENKDLAQGDEGYDADEVINYSDIAESTSVIATDLEAYNTALVAKMKEKINGSEVTETELNAKLDEAKKEISALRSQVEAKALAKKTKEALSKKVLELKKAKIGETLESLGLTDDKKTEVNNKLDAFILEGTQEGQELNNADRLAKVEKALLDMSKLEANTTLDKKLEEALAHIDGLNATPNKDAIKGDITAKIEAIKAKITGEETADNTAIDNLVDEGLKEIAHVLAKTDVTDAYNTVLAKIKDSTASTDRQQEDIDKLEKLKEKHLANIETAYANADNKEAKKALDTANQGGVTEISNLPIAKAKIEAEEQLTKKLEEKIKEVDSSNASDETKEKVKDKLKEIKDNASNAIEAREDTKENKAETDLLRDKAKADMDNVDIPTLKDDVYKAIDEKVEAKKKAIDELDSTDSAKEKAKKEVDDIANKAKAEIKKLKDDEAIKGAKDKAISDIDAVTPPTVKEELDKVVNDVIKKIEEKTKESIEKVENTDASQEDKEKAKEEIKEKAQNEIDKIKEIANSDKSDKEKLEEINKIDKELTGNDNLELPQAKELSQAKESAKARIDKALAKKLKDIDAVNDAGITDDVKAVFKKVAEQTAKIEKIKVDLTDTVDAAKKAGDDGVKAVEACKVPNGKTLDQSKLEAIEKINQAKEAKIAEMKAIANADKEELARKIALVEKIANYAIDSINSATTSDKLDKALNRGLTDIKNVKLPTSLYVGEDNNAAKEKAIADINKALELKLREIELSKSTKKEELKKYATDIANIEIDKVNATTTVDDAIRAGKDGVNRVNSIEIPAELAQGADVDAINKAKEAAKAEIDKALADKIAEIDANKEARPEAKKEAIDMATKEANSAKDKIDLLNDVDSINKSKDESIQIIKDVKVDMTNPVKHDLTDAINKAIEEIDAAVKAKKDEIDKSANNVDAKKKELDKLADVEKSKLYDAQTEKDVEDSKNISIDRINDFDANEDIVEQNIDEARKLAIKMIEDAVLNKLGEIAGKKNTDAVKKIYIELVRLESELAIGKINIALTSQEVMLIAKDAVNRIEAIDMPEVLSGNGSIFAPNASDTTDKSENDKNNTDKSENDKDTTDKSENDKDTTDKSENDKDTTDKSDKVDKSKKNQKDLPETGTEDDLHGINYILYSISGALLAAYYAVFRRRKDDEDDNK